MCVQICTKVLCWPRLPLPTSVTLPFPSITLHIFYTPFPLSSFYCCFLPLLHSKHLAELSFSHPSTRLSSCETNGSRGANAFPSLLCTHSPHCGLSPHTSSSALALFTKESTRHQKLYFRSCLQIDLLVGILSRDGSAHPLNPFPSKSCTLTPM